MTISDGIVITAFGAAISAMAGVVRVLWKRSEECREEHRIKDSRIDQLESVIATCPVEACVARKSWRPQYETRTGNGTGEGNSPRIEILKGARPA